MLPPILARHTLLTALAALALAAPPPLRAQQDDPATDRWAAAFELGFASSSGNSDLLSLTTGFQLKHRQTRLFKLDWRASFRYGESDDEVVARHLQSKLDFDVGPDARLAPFVFVSAERDPFRRLDLRAKTGSGLRYHFYRADAGEASLHLAAQYSREQYTSEAGRATDNDGGWGLELKVWQQLGEAVRVENATSYDPVYDDLADYTLDIKSKFSTRITRYLAFTLTHSYAHDAMPVEGVGRTDQLVHAGFTIDFEENP